MTFGFMEGGRPLNLDPRKPATTVAGDPRLTAREHHNHGEQNSTSTRITLDEAAALQTYPADFDWDAPVPDLKRAGKLKKPTKGKQFLQVGNAVPPLLAQAILAPIAAALAQEVNWEEAA